MKSQHSHMTGSSRRIARRDGNREVRQSLHARLAVEQQLIDDATTRGWQREIERHTATRRRIEQLLNDLGLRRLSDSDASSRWHPERVSAEQSRLRETFNGAAELYDRARPTYPPALVEDLVASGELGPHSRVLEIGPGTGQLTVPLARLGCHLTAVELGADLAAIARRNLTGFPEAHVVVAAFEEWPLPAEGYDLVAAATAWHWIDPRLRVAKTAAALIRGGIFATIATHHVTGGTTDFFAEAQSCYRQWDPATPPDWQLPQAQDIPHDPELDGSDYFEPAVFHGYHSNITYSTATYIDTLRTYSGLRSLTPADREALFECIANLIDTKYAGTIVKRYYFELRLAQRTRRSLTGLDQRQISK
jgi:SAM-dependent methyltransferase